MLDPATPFLELCPLAAGNLCTTRCPARESSPASGVVQGHEVMVVANDATVKGGTYYPLTVKKHLRAQEIALRKPPAVHLPGGLRRRVPAAAGRGFPDSDHFGRIFYNQARM